MAAPPPAPLPGPRRVSPCPVPAGALLSRYGDGGGRQGGFADAYAVVVAGTVTHADYVAAFYTTPLFRVERAILRWLAGRPSTDADARALADGAERFAAWRVEARAADQVLLADFTGRTRSWLAVEAVAGGTRLWFGSAVVPRGGERGPGFPFAALLGFHRLYSRLLLGAARRRLRAAS
ncbi:MAG: hypothetical protein JNK22_17750 [Rhodocyclaceae bacterium]|nr:hypothetical protein [Rhodocyclaceae bacterium]